MTLEHVEVSSWERIVERGTAQVTWLVRRAQGWVNAAQWPQARIESRDPGAATVWETRIEMQLPVGTTLMRVESLPGQPQRGNALDFLLHDRRSVPRRTIRTYYRVHHGGRLQRVE